MHLRRSVGVPQREDSVDTGKPLPSAAHNFGQHQGVAGHEANDRSCQGEAAGDAPSHRVYLRGHGQNSQAVPPNLRRNR